MKKYSFIQLEYGKKGNILLYFLVILNIVSTSISEYCIKLKKYSLMKEQIEEFREFAFVEVLTIKHIKQVYLDFEEEDETLNYEEYVIEITYDGLKAEFTITNEESNNSRKRILLFDDLEEMVEEYY